ncbi:hypothetical protein WHR41_00210 [Cladosporium halotolerans]|uniref:Alpha/beta hydrolase fold-3 domain-containing protein n=1 Tax=Cladosporium halotolerans TaxID=1052096 RepID=A0AB34L567_9PEZI
MTAQPPPGRLGDPSMTVLTDPRTHPIVKQTLSALGMGEEPLPDLPPTLSVDSLTPIIAANDAAFTAVSESLDNELPSDSSEPEISVTEHTIAGPDANPIRLWIYTPVAAAAAATAPLPAVVYVHGGAMVFIPTETKVHRRWTRSLAAQGAIAVLVDFRNAFTPPSTRNPFPAGLNDCAAATQWLAAHRAELGIGNIVLQGESGGANLAIATALKAKREGWLEGAVAGVYGIVPYVSNGSGWSEERKLAELPSLVENDGYVLSGAGMAAFGWYYGEDVLEDPRAWPYHASEEELRGLPPVVLEMAELDPLRDEGVAFARKLVAAGVQVRASVAVGLVHGAQVAFRKALPEQHEAAARDVVGFARSL